MDGKGVTSGIRAAMPNIDLADGPPWVKVYTESVYVHRSGQRAHHAGYEIMVAPDLAGDLATRPLTWVTPTGGDGSGVTEWQVCAVGFTEGEASAALRAAVLKVMHAGSPSTSSTGGA